MGVFLFSFIFVSSAYLQTVSNIDIFSSLMFRVVQVKAQSFEQNLRFPGATFEERKQSYLNKAISYWGSACNGNAYNDKSNQCIWVLLENNTSGQHTSVIEGCINNYLTCALSGKCEKSDHAVMVMAVRILLQYGDQISQASKNAILDEIIGNGFEALKTGCTSNMRFNDYMAYYLLTQDPAYNSKTMVCL